MNNCVRVSEEQAQAALDWVKEHCTTYITNDAEIENRGVYAIYYYRFYFQDNEQGRHEMTLFALRWA